MNAKPLPAYDDVVGRYGLDILKAPGDLVLKDGDIAVTKTGDLMLNNAEYSGLASLVRSWRYHVPTLQLLFDLGVVAKERRRQHDESINQVFINDRFDPKAENPFMPNKGSVARYHELNDQISVSELSVPIYAGAIVLVLNGMLQTLKYEIDATYDDWESEPLIEGCSVGAIIAASGNNFRHNDEWARTRRPTTKQLPSIRVLAAAFKEPIAADGSGHKFGRNMFEPKIPAHAQNDDLTVEMSAREQLFQALQLDHCRHLPVPGASLADESPCLHHSQKKDRD